MPVSISSTKALVLLSLVLLPGFGIETVFGMTSSHALQAVANISCSSNDFASAMTRLEHVKGAKGFWLKLAGDERFDADRRRRFVKHFFKHFVSRGMRLDQLPGADGEHISWLSYHRVRKQERGDLTGWVPETLLEGGSGFAIPILDDEDGEYHLVVFIAFREDLNLKDVLDILTSKLRNKNTAIARIAACATWDSEDQEKRYPGSKLLPWPWSVLNPVTHDHAGSVPHNRIFSGIHGPIMQLCGTDTRCSPG